MIQSSNPGSARSPASAISRRQTSTSRARPDERQHHVQVLVACFPDPAHGVQLEPEQVGLVRVAKRAAVADHRIRLDRLEAVTAAQVPELVGTEVDRAVGDRPRREASREGGQPLGHALDEGFRPALLKQRPRVLPVKRLDHHQLRPQQSHAIHGQRGGALDLGWLRQVQQQLGRGGRGRGRRRCGRPGR